MRTVQLAAAMREAGMSEREISKRVALAGRGKHHAEEAARRFYRSWSARYATQAAVCEDQMRGLRVRGKGVMW